MANLNVAVLGQPAYSEAMGKRGTSTDITFFNLKRGEGTVTFIEPSKYPERLASLFYAVSAASRVVLVVGEISPAFGETVVLLDALGLEDGIVIFKDSVPRDQALKFIRGTVVEKYQVMDDNPNALREVFLAEVAQQNPDPLQDQSEGTVVVDHSFNVKGVGVVALGCVKAGTVRVHQTLQALPDQKTAFVRSIQKHDDDFEWAAEGDRVGLALREVEVDNLERGTVLTDNQSIKTSLAVSADVNMVRYWPTPLKAGMVVHLGHWMQFMPARIESLTDGCNGQSPRISLGLEKPLAYKAGDHALLTQLDGGKLRIVGSLRLN